MSRIVAFFADHASSTQVGLYAGLISVLWLVELLFSGGGAREKWKHTRFNGLFVFTALPIQLFMTIFVLAMAGWVTTNHWGLLFLFPSPNGVWVKYVLAFVVLDFCDYVYHVTMHKFSRLWKFHLVHHTDHEVDVSTTVREHPGETFLRECFLIGFVFLTGASFGVLLVRQTAQTIANIISHNEHRLPVKLDRILAWVFITPNLHHVHHHFERPYTDCNYGDVFSIWDRIFGTYIELPSVDTRFGVDTHMDPAANCCFKKVISIPFKAKPVEPASEIGSASAR